MFQSYFDALEKAIQNVSADKDDQINIKNQNTFNLDEEFKDIEFLKVNDVFFLFKNGVQLNINVDDRSIYWNYWISRDFKEFLGKDFDFDKYRTKRHYIFLYNTYKNFFDEHINDFEEFRNVSLFHYFSVKNITTKARFGNEENPFETKIMSNIDFISIRFSKFPINDSFIEVLLFNYILIKNNNADLMIETYGMGSEFKGILIEWLVEVWPKLLKKRTLFNHPGLQEKIEIYNREFYNYVLKFKEFKKAYDEEDDVYFEAEYGGSYDEIEQDFKDKYYGTHLNDFDYDVDREIYIDNNGSEYDDDEIWDAIMESFDFFKELYNISPNLTHFAKYVVKRYPNF